MKTSTMSVTPPQAAGLLGVDIRTVRDWMRKGKLEASRITGNRWIINRESVDKLLVATPPPAKGIAKLSIKRYCHGFEVPDGFDLITTYKELKEYTVAFANRKWTFLLLVGSPGSGKSRQIKNDLNGVAHKWIDNHASHLGLYCSVYEAGNSPVVMDDINHFFKSKMACSLMKSLTQTEDERSVSWESTSKALDERRVPRSFRTTSPVCLIANKWDGIDPDMAAIQDRSTPVAFYPSAATIHERVLQLKWCDKNVSEFIGKNLERIPQPSMREYHQGMSYMHAGMRWQEKLLKLWGQQ